MSGKRADFIDRRGSGLKLSQYLRVFPQLESVYEKGYTNITIFENEQTTALADDRQKNI
jgi:hypothetical protein